MATVDGTFSGRTNHRLRLVVTQGAQSIAGNYTTVSWALYAQLASGTGSWSLSPQGNASVNIGGHTWSRGGWTYDFRSTSSILLGSGSFNIAHKADGTQSISFSGYADSSSTLGAASNSGSMGLTTIPRASTPTFEQPAGTNVTAVDAGSTVTIDTNRASSGFTHTMTWTFGGQSGTIGTGIGASTTWTPPLSLLNEIPSAMSGAAQITTTTYSGSTNVGSKVSTLTIRVPSSAAPDFTTVTHAEATVAPDVAGLIGAYVKDFTKLALAITGASAQYGASIVSHKIEIAGQTINAASGTTGVISQSGALTLKGTVTDSRSLTKTKEVTVNVLSYAPPAITTATAVRSTVGGTVDPNGTYIKVDIAAVTQSLIVGTQKNNLTWKIKTRSNGDATPWSSITPVAQATVASTGYADDSILGTYTVSDSFDVRIEVSDKLGSVSVLELTVSTGGTLVHFSHTVDGVGVGKYHEQGSIDALGQIYQNDGLAVIDEVSGDARYAAITHTHSSSSITDFETAVATNTRVVRGVIPSSVDITGGSATVDSDGTVWFTGVSRVSLNDVFDGLGSDIYQVVMEASASATAIWHELRADGVDIPGGVSFQRAATYSTLTTGPIRSVGDGVANFGYVVPTAGGGANRGNGTMFMANPAVANNLSYTMTSTCFANGTQYQWSEAGRSTGGTVSTYDGLTMACSGPMTGRIKVIKL